jgi:hypothetical protein
MHVLGLAHAHDRAFAELLFYLVYGQAEGFGLAFAAFGRRRDGLRFVFGSCHF